MNSYWVDTHAHIFMDGFDVDRSSVIDEAQQMLVRKILMPNIDFSTVENMVTVAEEYKNICYPMIGLHPCSVKSDYKDQLEKLEEFLVEGKWIAIGEIGTDLYWDKTHWKEQQDAFIVQLRWAKNAGLPVSIHCRESLSETIDILTSEQDGSLTGVLHCFTGTAEQAAQIHKIGLFVGVGGVVTFKNGGLDKVLDSVPLERIVLETDSPYLAPVPYRGKRNEPSYIPLIGRRVAEIKAISEEVVMDVTTKNALTLFKLEA